jgi:hypothetical protein
LKNDAMATITSHNKQNIIFLLAKVEKMPLDLEFYRRTNNWAHNIFLEPSDGDRTVSRFEGERRKNSV